MGWSRPGGVKIPEKSPFLVQNRVKTPPEGPKTSFLTPFWGKNNWEMPRKTPPGPQKRVILPPGGPEKGVPGCKSRGKMPFRAQLPGKAQICPKKGVFSRFLAPKVEKMPGRGQNPPKMPPNPLSAAGRRAPGGKMDQRDIWGTHMDHMGDALRGGTTPPGPPP